MSNNSEKFDYTLEGVTITDPNGYVLNKLIEGILSDENNFRTFFNTTPTAMVLVNADRKIKLINKAWKNIIYIDEMSMIGKRFGDGFRCIESLLSGCGSGKNCIICKVKNNIKKVVETGNPSYDIIIKHEFVSNDKGISPTLKTSFVPVTINQESLVLIMAEDVSDMLGQQ